MLHCRHISEGNIQYVDSEAPDQPSQSHSLIRDHPKDNLSLRLDCMDVQADLELQCPRMACDFQKAMYVTG